jgi:Gpi18-like mannosyltransferase
MWVDAVLPAAAIRLAVLLMAVFLVIVFRPDSLPQDNPFLQVWNRWDAPHFLEVAAGGYGPPTEPARIVLFPLFPALIAIGSTLAEPLVAGMLISTVATLAAAGGLYVLARRDYDRRTGQQPVRRFRLLGPKQASEFL